MRSVIKFIFPTSPKMKFLKSLLTHSTRNKVAQELCNLQTIARPWGITHVEKYLMRFAAPQLLGELLLDRKNGKVMLRYVSDPTNLKLQMILLKDSSRSIQFEAFHVFKVKSGLGLRVFGFRV